MTDPPTAKEIRVAPIRSDVARKLIISGHYSKKVVRNSQLHLGVFLRDRLLGAMSYGPPIDRGKMLGIVRGTAWENVIELNRMWFSDALPRNSESRALAVSFRMLKAHAPQVKWIVSFADAGQCGDGTIYRASGFVLTAIKPTVNQARMPSGEVIHKLSLESNPVGSGYYAITGGRYDFKKWCALVGAVPVPGYQFRYVRFLDPAWLDRLTEPVIPFDAIPDECRMVRGVRPVVAPREPPAERRCEADPDAPFSPRSKGNSDGETPPGG
jgi:hypothetical protein